MNKAKHLTGRTFGKLVVTGPSKTRTWIRFNGKVVSAAYSFCRCNCGKVIEVRNSLLLIGKQKSCGHDRNIYKLHGHASRKNRNPTWLTWMAMKKRCLSINDKNYASYGGRGITICKRWLDYKNFFEDMGTRPFGLTIGRIDNNAGYYKENCRWENRSQQQRNKRTSTLYIVNGVIGTVAELADVFGSHRYRAYKRLSAGWSIEDAILVPKLEHPPMRTLKRYLKHKHS